MAATEPAAFGALLKHYRLAVSLTQEELAEAAGISTRAISNLERGVNPTARKDTVALLADALHLSGRERTAFARAARGQVRPAGSMSARHNLPAPSTPLIGREREARALDALLRRPDVRLLTLTGPGGIGKTRLALHVAAGLMDDVADGVWFVDLAATSDPALVISTVARVLDVTEVGGQPLIATLHAALRQQRLLLLLDNFEQVIGAAPAVAALLAGCPLLKALVTSREVLRLSGEQQFPVSPLALPDPDDRPDLATLAQYEAVRLFRDRAAAVKPDFALADDNASAVAAICVRLDGLPLAIELAAARVKLLPPDALLHRLGRRLPLLTGGARDLPARQQTLRATIDWSYRLLTADEQALFRRLAVFVGGCTVAAAEALSGALDGGDVFTTLAALVDKSLVRQAIGREGEPRFRMLETIREYGLERLAAAGETAVVEKQHSAFYLRWVEEAEPQLRGPEQGIWLDRLAEEHDNIRSALRRALEWGEAERALRLAAAMWRFWSARGHLSEGRRWLDEALGASLDVPPRVRAAGLNAAGSLARDQGDLAEAAACHDASLQLWREVGDSLGMARSLNNLGVVASEQGDCARAIALYEESLSLFRQLGNTWNVANTLHNIGLALCDAGRLPEALERLTEVMPLWQAAGDPEGLARSLSVIGTVAFFQGDYPRAVTLQEESLALRREIGYQRMITVSLSLLADALLCQGETSRAAACLDEAIRLHAQIASTADLPECLDACGALAGMQGDAARAARVLGAADGLRERLGRAIPPSGVAYHARIVAAVRAQLDATRFTAAWEAGRHMPLEEAMAEALTERPVRAE